MTGIATKGQTVFGPVPSRRLGLSLGVDLLWPKTCTLDCIYCELGPTTVHTTKRDRFRDARQVLDQVEERLGQMESPPDFITLAGSGEPSLHLDMGLVLAELRSMSKARLAVLTNATLVDDPLVREELALADVVVPSLDAVSQEVFLRVNNPAPGLEIDRIRQGLAKLKRRMSGQMWLEMLLVQGVNDSEQEIAGLIRAAEFIGPDLVQLNTVIRPPAVPGTLPLAMDRLEEIAGRFAVPCEVSRPPQSRAGHDRGEHARQVLEMTKRRPCTVDDIAAMAGLDGEGARSLVEELLTEGKLQREVFGDQTYYRGL